MGETLGALLQLVLQAVGAVPIPEAGLLGIAASVIALALLTLVMAVVSPRTLLRSASHPRRAIDVSVLLAQSDPRADGHPRPRAPGVAHAA
ncbi:MAG: DUF6412 domain-containing protein [Microbacterium sp.]